MGTGEEVYRYQIRYMILKESANSAKAASDDGSYFKTVIRKHRCQAHFQFAVFEGHPNQYCSVTWSESVRTSGSIAGGHPWCPARLQVQYNRKPLRCQRTRVSGLKIANV